MKNEYNIDYDKIYNIEYKKLDFSSFDELKFFESLLDAFENNKEELSELDEKVLYLASLAIRDKIDYYNRLIEQLFYYIILFMRVDNDIDCYVLLETKIFYILNMLNLEDNDYCSDKILKDINQNDIDSIISYEYENVTLGFKDINKYYIKYLFSDMSIFNPKLFCSRLYEYIKDKYFDESKNILRVRM